MFNVYLKYIKKTFKFSENKVHYIDFKNWQKFLNLILPLNKEYIIILEIKMIN